MPRRRSRDTHQPVLCGAGGFAGPLEALCVCVGLTGFVAAGVGWDAEAGFASALGFDGAADSFQSGAKGCFVPAFFATMSRALGVRATARSSESLVAS